jgi:hypothetical protein
MSSINKYVMLGSAVVVAGAAIWFLSQDQETIKFDSKVHSKELLRLIVKDLFVQGATAYSQKLVMIKNLTKSGELVYDVIENFKHKHQQEMDEIELEVYIDHKVNDLIVQDMLKLYGDDLEVKKMFEDLRNIED